MTRRLAIAVAAVAALLPAQDAILSQLPADTSSLLVVRDPLVHVDALLASPLLRDVLASSGDLAAPPLPAGKLVDWGECRGDHLAAVWEGLARWSDVASTTEVGRRAARVLHALTPLVTAVDVLDWS